MTGIRDQGSGIRELGACCTYAPTAVRAGSSLARPQRPKVATTHDPLLALPAPGPRSPVPRAGGGR
jgi:hypothetical protein